MNRKWGFLRETNQIAIKSGIDKDTGLHRTGLEDYLRVIFPKINDWLHDKTLGKIDGITYRTRPDYRSEELKIIIEFDGLPHYTNPDIIEKDLKNTNIYEKLGYKVIRIPYFIQLTNKAVKILFDVEVEEELFDDSIPSLGIKGRNTPAYLCPAGIKRMAREFRSFPEQYKTNLEALYEQNDIFKSGIDYLEKEYGDVVS